MLDYPQHHLVGDDVAILWYLFVVFEHRESDVNDNNLDKHWDRSPLLVNRLHAE